MGAPGQLIRRIPEFSANHGIKLAPDTTVPVTDRLLQVIDSRSFQRLRTIRQLSLADKIFPSATHTRFSHGLGVYKNLLDYLVHLDGFPEFHDVYDEQDYLSILLAGLLHDLGHFPCAHQLEGTPPFIKHEDLTIRLLDGRFSFKGEDLGRIIRSAFGIPVSKITRFFQPDAQLDTKYLLLKQLIDSPVDADKCDYLPRDSYFCGIDHGTGFDRIRFISNLMPSRQGTALGIHEKGLVSAERFQLARYWMYRSVYWGHTVRAFTSMLTEACKHLTRVDDPLSWHQDILHLDDHTFFPWLREQLQRPGRELLDGIEKSRTPYKRLYTVSSHHDPEAYERLQDAATRERIIDWLHQWSKSHDLRLAPHHLIWDLPPLYKRAKWETFQVHTNDNREIPCDQESPVIHALGGAFLQGVRKIRLFCAPRVWEQLQAARREMPALTHL